MSCSFVTLSLCVQSARQAFTETSALASAIARTRWSVSHLAEDAIALLGGTDRSARMVSER